MANPTARLLRLLSLLQHHRFWPGAELADRLGVSARTLRRDVDRLRELGYPVAASRGVAGGYQLRSGATMPPLVVDDDEAVAIAVSLSAAAGGAVGGIGESSVHALAKVVQVLPPRLRRRVDALRAYTVPPSLAGGPAVDAAALTTIALACRDSERLRFDYTARDGEQTHRAVEPHRLVPLGRRWYLVAWDTDRADWRTFRLDRLAAVAGTGARFGPRELPAPDAATFVRDRLDAAPARYQVVVEVAAPAAAVRREVADWGNVTARDGGSCRLEMAVDSLDWPALILGAVGAGFRVVSPPELRAHLRRTGELLLRSTDEPRELRTG